MPTLALHNLHVAELINALARARDTFVAVIDEGAKPDRYTIVEAFGAIDAAADFLMDLHLTSHEGGNRE
jgi:hypothetical protein